MNSKRARRGGKTSPDTVEKFLFVSLIATLPFFSLRSLTGGVSVWLIILCVIFARTVVSVEFVSRAKNTVCDFDYIVVLYLILALFSSVYVDNEYYGGALLRSVCYFSLYIGLKVLISKLDSYSVFDAIYKGCVIGLILYISVVVAAVYLSGVGTSIFSSLDYWGFTYRIYASVELLMGGDNSDFESRKVMRNTIGEAFAFYAIVFFVSAVLTGKKAALFLLALASIIAVLTFSRRAVIEIGLGIFIVSYASSYSASRIRSVGMLFLACIFYISVVEYLPQFENRFGGTAGDGRITQYAAAIDQLGSSFVFGLGYGEKVDGIASVHNFIIGGLFMLGLLGMVISGTLVFLIAKRLVYLVKQGISFSAMLVIPLVGCMVAGTVGGMFGPVAWICLALVLPRYTWLTLTEVGSDNSVEALGSEQSILQQKGKKKSKRYGF